MSVAASKMGKGNSNQKQPGSYAALAQLPAKDVPVRLQQPVILLDIKAICCLLAPLHNNSSNSDWHSRGDLRPLPLTIGRILLITTDTVPEALGILANSCLESSTEHAFPSSVLPKNIHLKNSLFLHLTGQNFGALSCYHNNHHRPERIFCQTVAHSSSLKKSRVVIAHFDVKGPKVHYKEDKKTRAKQTAYSSVERCQLQGETQLL